jgi:hypothetical protein
MAVKHLHFSDVIEYLEMSLRISLSRSLSHVCRCVCHESLNFFSVVHLLSIFTYTPKRNLPNIIFNRVKRRCWYTQADNRNSDKKIIIKLK